MACADAVKIGDLVSPIVVKNRPGATTYRLYEYHTTQYDDVRSECGTPFKIPRPNKVIGKFLGGEIGIILDVQNRAPDGFMVRIVTSSLSIGWLSAHHLKVEISKWV